MGNKPFRGTFMCSKRLPNTSFLKSNASQNDTKLPLGNAYPRKTGRKVTIFLVRKISVVVVGASLNSGEHIP